MMWLIQNVRRTAKRGMVIIVCPPLSSDQFFIKCSSLAPAMDRRLASRFLSKISRTCFLDVAMVGCIGCPPGGLKSRESCSMVGTAQPASSATCPASRFSGIDFSCGFHDSLSSGIRSSVFLAVAISWSNSDRNRSLSFIGCSLIGWKLYDIREGPIAVGYSLKLNPERPRELLKDRSLIRNAGHAHREDRRM